MKAERVTESVSYHGEGPCWWPRLQRIRFVDMLAGAVLTVSDDGSVERHRLASDAGQTKVAAMIRPRAGGGAVMLGEHGLVLAADDELTRLTFCPSVVTDDGIRFNEGGCDPRGRLYAGTMAYAKTPGAAVMVRFDDDSGAATPIAEGLTISNGLGWSPDGTRAYYNDTTTGRTDVFDEDPERGLVNRRPFVTHADGDHPDGLCVDAEGGVWVALNHGFAVARYAPDGRLTERIELPVSQVTACTFGGRDLDTLYITTSRENLPDDAEPEAGSLYAVRPGVRGLPPLEAAF